MRDSEEQHRQRVARQDEQLRPEHEMDDYTEEDESVPSMELPPNGLLKASIAGVGAGVVCSLISIVITLMNASGYEQAKSGKAPINLLFMLDGFWCVGIIVSLVICYFTGFFVGRSTVQRRLGFLAGALVGIVINLGNIIVRYIPNYPENLTAQGSTSAGAFTGGVLFSILLLLTVGAIYGLIGLWGAYKATKMHPYYLEADTAA